MKYSFYFLLETFRIIVNREIEWKDFEVFHMKYAV